ncbi:hypothetical protein [Pseudalkalibacillus caeni]|nr:hypothetical protein [Pseudalkalibacillus caeni]
MSNSNARTSTGSKKNYFVVEQIDERPEKKNESPNPNCANIDIITE